MGWKNGSPCFYCNADLQALTRHWRVKADLSEVEREVLDWEFQRHMNSECIYNPRNDRERRRVEWLSMADAYAREDGYID